jgi:hypothetical protein
MRLTASTLSNFFRIGVMASLFIILLKFLVARVPAPDGLRAAVGTI